MKTFEHQIKFLCDEIINGKIIDKKEFYNLIDNLIKMNEPHPINHHIYNHSRYADISGILYAAASIKGLPWDFYNKRLKLDEIPNQS